MRRRGKILVLVLMTVLVNLFPRLAYSRPSPTARNVLVLHSYHIGLGWTDRLDRGIRETFADSGLDISVSVQHLDWKRHPQEEGLEFLGKMLGFKYGNQYPFDVIVVTDDKALEFASKIRGEYLPDAPIVFGGVIEKSARALTTGVDNVVGVFESVDPGGTIRLIKELQPDIRTLYVMSDHMESGYATGLTIKEKAQQIDPDLVVRFLAGEKLSDLVEAVKDLPIDSAVLMGPYTVDEAGQVYEPESVVQAISLVSSVPVYHLHDFLLNYGIMGGYLFDGFIHGKHVADKALDILRGRAVAGMESRAVDSARMVLDYNQLLRFSIPEARIPLDAEIINKPFSFIETYRSLVLSVAMVIAGLVLFIVSLLWNIRKRKEAEASLASQNTELAALNEQIEASEEELRQQYLTILENESKLRDSEERYRIVSESSSEAIWDWDIQGNRVEVTGNGSDVFGRSIQDTSRKPPWWHLIHPDDRQRNLDSLNAHLDGTIPVYRCEHRLKVADGYRWVRAAGKALRDGQGRPYRMFGSIADITGLKEQESKITHMAYHDPLTGLPNRAKLMEAAYTLIQVGETFALVFLDLDDFKNINDSHGHFTGDKLLVEISKRLSAVVPPNCFLGRLGGDEFLLLVPYTQLPEVQKFVTGVQSAFIEEFLVEELSLKVTTTGGVSLYPIDGEDFEDLMMTADTALYEAKKKGKGSFVFFTVALQKRLQRRMRLEEAINRGLADEEFEVHYQPVHAIDSGELVGFEALVRWTSEELGKIAPDEFIPIAEETGVIIPLGEFVLRKACELARVLADRYDRHLKISVNISTVQLRNERFLESVRQITTGLQPGISMISLEVTESVLMESLERSTYLLTELKKLGIEVLLDDFGTGYSSLAYLRRLPVDYIKVDRSFIQKLFIEPSSVHLVDSVVLLAHKMGLRVVAEGVETQEQLEYLASKSCDFAQGYLFSKPIDEKTVLNYCDRLLGQRGQAIG